MRISEAARLTGLVPSAIRYYEQHDMFSPGQVERTSNGYRNYTQGALRRLELVQAGRDAGFSLAEMKSRLRDWDDLPDSRRAEILTAQLEVIDDRIQRLAKSRGAIHEALETLKARLDVPSGPEDSGAPKVRQKTGGPRAGRMTRERYYTADWEWGCCGGPLRVGDQVELEVQCDSEYARNMRSELATVLAEPLTGVETHHDDEVVIRRGRIVALDAVIADTRWTVTPREIPGPGREDFGDGIFASFGSAEPGQAEGTRIEGTSRLMPITVVPDGAAEPEGSGPDCAVIGEQVRPGLDGYVITIEVS